MEPTRIAFYPNVVKKTIVKRLNKFSVLVKNNGEASLALLRNTGRLENLVFEGAKALCAPKKWRRQNQLRDVRDIGR